MCRKKCAKRFTTKYAARTAIFGICFFLSFYSYADGVEGIDQASTMMKSFFASGTNLMYAIGALVGLVGGVKVFNKWNHGDHDTGKVAAAWFGSCIFLVVVATVLKSFFGL